MELILHVWMAFVVLVAGVVFFCSGEGCMHGLN